MKVIRGTAKNITTPLIGRIKKGNYSLGLKKDIILASGEIPSVTLGCVAVLTTKQNNEMSRPYISVSEDDLLVLQDGDIVRLNPDGSIQILWEALSQQNAIFITDACNSACIMCPQTSSGIPNSYHRDNKRILSLVDDSDKVEHIGITGGEPTVCLDDLVDILGVCHARFPKACVSLLTNGKALSDFENAKRLSDANPNVTYCIPLYAPIDSEHDLIVGVRGSFEQTILGLYNLARLRRPVEIRIVVIKQNYQRLTDLAEFIYRNMPFVVHVAIMGMETSGVAKENLEKVWVDPNEYQQELKQCILAFTRRAMNVSIYNLPHCLIPKELWKFARDSISGWKKAYLPQCEGCRVKESCAGTFATSTRQSQFISPIKGAAQ